MKKNFLALWHNEIARYRYFIGAVALSSVYLRFGGALWELSFAENIFQTIGCPRFISILAVGIFDSIVTLCLWFSIMVFASFFMARQKGSFNISCLAILIFVFIGISAYAIAADDTSDSYRDSRRDWYFYKKELIKPDTEEKKAEQKPAPSVSGMLPKELWNMHPDQFKELIEVTHKRMVQYPDDDNIMGEWLYLKDIARRKSLAVTSAEMAYVQRHPEYNMNKDAPVINKGKAVLYSEQQEAVESRLKQEKGNFGLLYFYSPNCGYCIEQSGILKFFINKYKWDIKGVDVTREPDAKVQFNIGTTPTLLLVQRSSGDSMTIAVGVVSLDEIEGTIYKAIRYLSKEITPEQWNVYEFQKDGLMDPLATVKTKPEINKSITNDY